jgi:hypothetical protein
MLRVLRLLALPWRQAGLMQKGWNWAQPRVPAVLSVHMH